MRLSKAFLATLRENPRDAEIISHQLMMRSNMLRKHAAGLYSYLPFMVKSYQKLCQIIREEFDLIGWQEVMMPFVIPGDLWKETGRWDAMGPEMARLQDRKKNDYCLGPTHEEVVTDLVRAQVNSYKQLPLTLFQITSKFRDETRPRFGIMRGREFSMMDGYSFHADRDSLDKHYEEVAVAYEKIFNRAGLKFCKVEADTGAIGGTGSHEYHVLAQSGEDLILSCPVCSYGANVEKAETPLGKKQKRDWGTAASKAMEKVSTPTQKTIEDVGAFLKIPSHRSLKTLVYKFNTTSDARTWTPVAAFILGHRQLNEVKLKAALSSAGHKNVQDVATLAEADVEKLFNSPVGFLGPKGLPSSLIQFFDREILHTHEIVMGANEAGFHLQHVEPSRDLNLSVTHDLVNAVAGDSCPRDNCSGSLEENRGIEVGHIFKLGTKYSSSMKAEFQDAEKKSHPMEMGCYGIGVTRLLAACIEQNHDADGIIWPETVAPYKAVIVNLGPNEADVNKVAEQFYSEFKKRGIDCLIDDRDMAPGAKFKDADLLGIPYRFVIGKKGLEKSEIEFSTRRAPRDKKFLKWNGDVSSVITESKM